MGAQVRTAEWLGSGATLAFAPRPLGFGAALLGLPAADARYDAETLVRTVRKEADLLRPAVALIGSDATSLAEALGATVEPAADGSWSIAGGSLPDRGDWAVLELPEAARAQALSAGLSAARALGAACSVGIVLPGPAELAAQIHPGPDPERDDDWEDLVDGCALVVTDAVKRIVAEAGCAVVLHDRALGSPRVVEELYAPLVRVLRHSGLTAPVVLDGVDPGWIDALQAVDVLSTVACVGDAESRGSGCGAAPAAQLWDGSSEAFDERVDHELAALAEAGADRPLLYSPAVPATASPERVQTLAKRLGRVA